MMNKSTIPIFHQGPQAMNRMLVASNIKKAPPAQIEWAAFFFRMSILS